MPASSPRISCNNKTSQFSWVSDHLRYILCSISAQSWLSVPPAPAWISIKAFKWSASSFNKLMYRILSDNFNVDLTSSWSSFNRDCSLFSWIKLKISWFSFIDFSNLSKSSILFSIFLISWKIFFASFFSQIFGSVLFTFKCSNFFFKEW